jgi:hypothetical protein
MSTALPHAVAVVLDQMIEKAYREALCDIVTNTAVSTNERLVAALDTATGAPVPSIRFLVTESALTISDTAGRSVSFGTNDPLLPLWCAGAVSELTEQPT